jgi:tetratricopeptide (TPR) repeat protein
MATDQNLSLGEAAERAGDYARAAAAYSEASVANEPLVSAEAYFRLGRLAWRQNDYARALRLYETARVRAVELEADELRARIENGIGAVHYARGAYTQGRACYKAALDLTRDEAVRAKILLNLGVIDNIEGDLKGARAAYVRSRDIARRLGDREGEAFAQHNLGMLHADLAEWEAAREAFAECLRLAEERGNRQMVGTVLLNEAEVDCAQGYFEDAIARTGQAIAILSEVGDEVERAQALRWQGVAHLGLGRLDRARQSFAEALRVASRTGSRLLEAEVTRELGVTASADQDTAAAIDWLTRARTQFESLGARREVDDVNAKIDQLRGRPRDARPRDEGRAPQ